MLRPAATVMEVAAGVGAHALALASAAGNDGHLMLYESHPVMRQILRKNLAANRVANVTLMRRMLAERASRQQSLESLDDLQLDRLDLLKANDANGGDGRPCRGRRYALASATIALSGGGRRKAR